jgi:hypothetical protein
LKPNCGPQLLLSNPNGLNGSVVAQGRAAIFLCLF